MSDLSEIRPVDQVTGAATEKVIPLDPVVPEAPAPVEPQEELISVMAQEAYFMEDCVKVVMNGGIEKLITYETFIEIMKKVTGVIQDTKIDGFSLPANTFFFAKNTDTIQMSTYYPAGVFNLKYYHHKKDIVTPNIIVSHILRHRGGKEWEVESSRYFCTDLNIGNLPRTFINAPSNNSRIWILPMSNTYSEGNMCYGNNQMTRRFSDNNLRGLDWYFQYMWESPFNDDLGIRAVGDVYVGDWYSQLAEHAKKKEPFPYSRLRGYTPR